ncbi:unnamed protein product [Heterobilharzia americana]|nr:unnamed protein product [Heterobilharzia americana]
MDFAHMIFRVALSGDATSLSQVLHENPDLVNLPDFDGNMPLHFAAMSGSSECVRICISVLQTREDLDCAVEVQRKNFMGQDALTLAVEKSDYESFSLLLNAGAETDYRLMDSVPPLVAALGQGNVKLTADVLDALEINFVRSRHDGYWLSALHTDLSISLAYFKLLKAHAVPFTLDDFEEICATVLEKEPAVKGIEEFLTFLGSDAVEPRLGLKFLSNLQDWPRFISTDDKTRLLSMLISCYVEASQLIILPKSVAQLLPLTLVDRHNYLDGSMHNWLDEWLSEPRSLLLWSKITVRACLRHSIRHCNSPKQPIDELIRSLPIPLALQQYVAKNEYV